MVASLLVGFVRGDAHRRAPPRLAHDVGGGRCGQGASDCVDQGGAQVRGIDSFTKLCASTCRGRPFIVDVHFPLPLLLLVQLRRLLSASQGAAEGELHSHAPANVGLGQALALALWALSRLRLVRVTIPPVVERSGGHSADTEGEIDPRKRVISSVNFEAAAVARLPGERTGNRADAYSNPLLPTVHPLIARLLLRVEADAGAMDVQSLILCIRAVSKVLRETERIANGLDSSSPGPGLGSRGSSSSSSGGRGYAELSASPPRLRECNEEVVSTGDRRGKAARLLALVPGRVARTLASHLLSERSISRLTAAGDPSSLRRQLAAVAAAAAGIPHGSATVAGGVARLAEAVEASLPLLGVREIGVILASLARLGHAPSPQLLGQAKQRAEELRRQRQEGVASLAVRLSDLLPETESRLPPEARRSEAPFRHRKRGPLSARAQVLALQKEQEDAGTRRQGRDGKRPRETGCDDTSVVGAFGPPNGLFEADDLLELIGRMERAGRGRS